MELKLECGCGQRFAFDVQPVDGQMPMAVNCPGCGSDSTSAANAILAKIFAPQTPLVASADSAPPPVKKPGLQFSRTTHNAAATPAPSVTPPALPPLPANSAKAAQPALVTSKPARKGFPEFNLGLGILGALLGAGLGVGLMLGFAMLTGVKFPLLGVGIGALTGWGARLMFRGTDNTLGIASSGIALAAVAATLYLMFGSIAIINIISLGVSVSICYRITSE